MVLVVAIRAGRLGARSLLGDLCCQNAVVARKT